MRHTRDASIWQVIYYEHIVRDEGEWDRIREVIAANPSRWAYDRENRSGLTMTDQWLEDEQSWFCKSNLKSSHA